MLQLFNSKQMMKEFLCKIKIPKYCSANLNKNSSFLTWIDKYFNFIKKHDLFTGPSSIGYFSYFNSYVLFYNFNHMWNEKSQKHSLALKIKSAMGCYENNAF